MDQNNQPQKPKRDPEFMRKIASKGGKNSPRVGGFDKMDASKHRSLSAKGGRISRRGKAKNAQ